MNLGSNFEDRLNSEKTYPRSHSNPLGPLYLTEGTDSNIALRSFLNVIIVEILLEVISYADQSITEFLTTAELRADIADDVQAFGKLDG